MIIFTFDFDVKLNKSAEKQRDFRRKRGKVNLVFCSSRKSYNKVNGCVQNWPQPRLEILMEVAEKLDLDVKELIISNKPQNYE